MGDGTASRAAGVRLKKMRGSRLRCVMNRTDGQPLFSFWPSEASREPRVLLEEIGYYVVNNRSVCTNDCKALSFSARASPLRVFGFSLAMKV